MFACAACADELDYRRAERFIGRKQCALSTCATVLGLTNHARLTNQYAIAKHSIVAFKRSRVPTVTHKNEQPADLTPMESLTCCPICWEAYYFSEAKQARCLPCGHTLCAACLGMCRSTSSRELLRHGCSTDCIVLSIGLVLRQAPCSNPLQVLGTVQPAEQSYKMIGCQATRASMPLKPSADKSGLAELVGSSLLLTWSLPTRCLDRELQQECKLEDYALEVSISRCAV